MARSVSTPKKTSSHSEKVEYRRLVVKLGTNLLAGDEQSLNLDLMSNLVEQVAQLHRAGVEVVIVSSGAIASGRGILKQASRQRGVPMRQVLASVGQGRLMQAYDRLFDVHDITVAQALVSKHDLSDRLGYLNVRNTLSKLLELGVIPIVNENDVVSVDEIRESQFGDNDSLSAMVANLIDADILMILTDTEGLYTADPHKAPDARLISRVEVIDDGIRALAGGTGSPLAIGGMVTKVEAAHAATTSGVNVVIANGREEGVVLRLAAGEALGTFFPSSTDRKESRQRWMLSGINSKGAIKIDGGAARALKRGGKSLLPAGVTGVEGSFRRGDVVNILGPDGTRIATGLTNYDAKDVTTIQGVNSSAIQELLGAEYGEEVVHRNNLVLL